MVPPGLNTYMNSRSFTEANAPLLNCSVARHWPMRSNVGLSPAGGGCGAGRQAARASRTTNVPALTRMGPVSSARYGWVSGAGADGSVDALPPGSHEVVGTTGGTVWALRYATTVQTASVPMTPPNAGIPLGRP